MTGHPIGLVIAIGSLLLGLLSRTPVAFLLLASLFDHRKQKITGQSLILLRL